jgi:hypothetical protein
VDGTNSLLYLQHLGQYRTRKCKEHTSSLVFFYSGPLNETDSRDIVSTSLLRGIFHSLQKNMGIIAFGAFCMFMCVCKYIILAPEKRKTPWVLSKGLQQKLVGSDAHIYEYFIVMVLQVVFSLGNKGRIIF